MEHLSSGLNVFQICDIRLEIDIMAGWNVAKGFRQFQDLQSLFMLPQCFSVDTPLATLLLAVYLLIAIITLLKNCEA